jgi:hypothetical protein
MCVLIHSMRVAKRLRHAARERPKKSGGFQDVHVKAWLKTGLYYRHVTKLGSGSSRQIP